MLTTLRREYSQLITSGGQLLLLLGGLHFHSRIRLVLVSGRVAVISLFAWYSTLYRLRAIMVRPLRVSRLLRKATSN